MFSGGRGSRGRGGGGPRIVRSNHVIQCIKYNNVALFKGDTYTYRGIFRRNGGEYNRQFYGFIVSLDAIETIKNELSPMLSGFVISVKYEDLTGVCAPANFVEDNENSPIETKPSIVQFSIATEEEQVEYENSTSTNLVI